MSPMHLPSKSNQWLLPGASCYSPRDRVRIDVVFAMIRIGRKYEIQHLLKEGIARLQAEFPATLDAHDNIADTISWNGIIDNDEVGSDVLFGIANFCTTHSDMKELLPLLPLAYYWVNCRNLVSRLLQPNSSPHPTKPCSFTFLGTVDDTRRRLTRGGGRCPNFALSGGTKGMPSGAPEAD